jgi:type IX secretion system PorP/SprF family membrane protein
MFVDWGKVYMPEESDIAYQGQSGENFAFDANFGLYYYSDTWYIGLSSKHLLEQTIGTQELYDETLSNTLFRQFYGMAGIAIPMNDYLVLEPSILGKYVRQAPFQMDFNCNLLIREVFRVGASYRTENTLVFLAEVIVKQRLRIGYSYDIFTNELAQYNQGSHEIMIGFDFPVFKRRMLTPRYF